jgi:hypothetical protein
MGFWDDVKKEREKFTLKAVAQREEENLQAKKSEKQYQKERIKELERDKIPYCPKCISTQLTYVDKKLSIGRALIGGVIAGGAGAVLGGLSSKKGKVKCLNCGHTWKL